MGLTKAAIVDFLIFAFNLLKQDIFDISKWKNMMFCMSIIVVKAGSVVLFITFRFSIRVLLPFWMLRTSLA